jgi:essential nuclear protein 1
MPKTKKVTHGADLSKQIEADIVVQSRGKARAKNSAKQRDEEEEVLPARVSRKILDVARGQQADMAAEADDMGPSSGRTARGSGLAALASSVGRASASSQALRASGMAVSGKAYADDDLEDDDDGFGDDDEEDGFGREDEEFAIGGEDEGLDLGVKDGYVVHGGSAHDVELFNRLMAASSGDQTDALRHAVDAQLRAAAPPSVGGASAMMGMGFSPKVIKVFSEVAAFMTKYRAGRLPKVMKILPGMAGWEELLALTDPGGWTPHAFYAVTRVFASNLNEVRAQRFFNLYLLPAVRNDIQSNTKLNYHLYQALRKALYKPAAWYKGILLPLAAGGDCTLREAVIVSSVLTTKHVPQPASAAAIYKLATMRYSPAVSVFLKLLLNKKYALQHRIIDALVDHFVIFARIPGPLPTLWHQCFLTFVQRYKAHTTMDGRNRLKDLLLAHVHPGITAEVRRELFSVPARDAPAMLHGSSGPVGHTVSAGADDDDDIPM